MIGKIILSTEDRIILHLLDYSRFEKDDFLPIEVTQLGISQATGIAQSHVSRILKKLKDQGLIQYKLARVASIGRRWKVYFLTWESLISAQKLKAELCETKVSFKDARGNLKEGRLSEALDSFEKKVNFLDAVDAFNSSSVIDSASIESVIAAKEKLKRLKK